jgi:RNA polymerase sigma-70 factor (ECF subfamily)
MNATGPDRSEAELVALAQQGDRHAFEVLIEQRIPALRRLLRRLVGDPQDAADLLQDTLVRAYTRFGTFRGDAKLTTWLYTIATRIAIDYLESRRLRADAKLRLRDHVHDDPHHAAELEEIRNDEGSRFDAREHIAFCFACVSRSLPTEEQAALVLRDVLELGNDEAARVLEISTSVLRHRLARARTTMQTRYEGLCRLVSKTGVCYQCEGLRDSFPDGRGGPDVPTLAQPDDRPGQSLRRRLAVVRDADVESGASQRFHALLWRALATLQSA